jgi:hypothetical protein
VGKEQRDLLVAQFVGEGLQRAGAQVVLIPHDKVMCLQIIMEAIRVIITPRV